jgi:7-keto-8-aminopelargonate synthetase-like enzyme
VIEPEPLQQVDRTFVRFRGRKLSNFSGCDYFRLASHPQVMKALKMGLSQYGLSVSASRLTTGNHTLYRRLEEDLARFFGAPSALLLGGGYLANLAVAQALSGQFSHALIDEHAHPSLNDAARFLDCPVLRFKHRATAELQLAVARCGPGAKLIVLTDGMFSRDGSAAPLSEYLEVLPEDAQLLVDDAHGAGVLGKTGKGTLEHEGVRRERVVQTVTLSKAFGAFGGAILCTKALRECIVSRSELFAGSTPLPLPLASAAQQACSLIRASRRFQEALRHNSRLGKEQLRAAGLPLPQTPGPIIALKPQGPTVRARLQRALFAAGIYPSFIRYPGGPADGYFRFVISSEHSKAQIDRLTRVLASFRSGLEPV